MKFKSLIPFLILILTLLISACSSDQPANPIDSGENVDPTWQFQQQLRAAGKVILSHPIELSFPISGQIEELKVDQGDIVSVGDILVLMDTSLIQKEVAQRESDLAVAKANLARVLVGPSQAEIVQAESDLIAAESTRPLTAPQRTMQAADIAYAQAYLEYLNTLPIQEDINLAQAGIDSAERDIEAALARMEKATLKSPINGDIIEILVNTFEFAGTGQTIIILSDLNELSVVLWMDEIDAARISLGDNATVSFEALPRITVLGIVTKISPNSDVTDPRDFNVELKLLEIPKDLRWGMSAEATFD